MIPYQTSILYSCYDALFVVLQNTNHLFLMLPSMFLFVTELNIGQSLSMNGFAGVVLGPFYCYFRCIFSDHEQIPVVFFFDKSHLFVIS